MIFTKVLQKGGGGIPSGYTKTKRSILLVSDGCATAAGPRDLRLKHDGRSLPAPFLPVKVGSVDFPMEKGGTMFF